MPLNAASPLWAIAQLLKDRQLYSGALTGATTRTADGTLLNFPSTVRVASRPVREELANGLLAPAMAAAPSSKAADAFRLARRTVDEAFPTTKVQGSHFDLVARPPDSTAIAALQGPQATGDASTAFLNDLVANPERKGAGSALLSSILRNQDVLPTSKQVLFTPLQGAKDFYKNKFGAYLMSPDEALSDPYIKQMLEKLGETGNASDLGVGIIQRAEGGSVMDGPTLGDKVSDVGYAAVKGGLEALKDPTVLASMMVGGPLGLALGLMGSEAAEALPTIVPAAMRAGLWPQVRYRAAVPGKFEATHATPEAANAYLRKHATTPNGWDDGAHIAPVFVSRERDSLFPEHDYFPTLRTLGATR